MKVFEFKQFLLILCIAVMPVLAKAANLGKSNLLSNVGEPLLAEIDVVCSADELVGLTASLASSDDIYIGDGVAKPSVQKSIKVNVVKKDTGQVVVRLTTESAVSEPVVNVVVAISWKDELLWREYTLNLARPKNSSPVLGNTNKAVATALANKKNNSLASPAAPKTVEKPEPASKASQPDNLQSVNTRKGDSLSSIAKRIEIQDVNLDQMLAGLFDANKNAFEGENMNRLRVGKTLKVPSVDVLQSMSPLAAKSLVRAHTQDWSAYTNKLAEGVKKSANNGKLAVQSGVGKVVTKAEKTLAQDKLSRDVVRVSKSKSGKASKALTEQDDLAAQQNAIKDADEKAAVLERQISGLKDLLEIKQKAADAELNGESKPAE